jgi:hypothetical protein
MESERLEFLFGDTRSGGRLDLDDVEVRSRLLERSFRGETTAAQLLAREVIAGQVYAGDPPEVWATAQRLLAGGLDREDVFRELAMAFAATARGGADDGVFDRDGYVVALGRLPVPAPGDVERVLIDIVRSEPGIDAPRLERATLERLGRDADDDVAGEIVGQIMDYLVDELGPLAWLSGDRTVHVGDLTAGIVLTHRLSETERSADTLDASFDLAGFGRLDDLLLSDGGSVDVVSVEDGDLGWIGPEGWLERFEVDDLLAVRVSDGGLVEVTAIAPPPLDPELVERLRAVYDDEVEEPWLPVPAEDLVLGLQFGDRSTFGDTRPPLTELCEAAGLERRLDEVAHDATVWHSQVRGRRTWRVMNLFDHDRPRVRSALWVLDLADVAAGIDLSGDPDSPGKADDEALHSALAEMGDPEVLDAVAAELFDGLEPGRADVTAQFVDALLAVATGPGEHSVASFLACVRSERAGDPVAAEAHLEAGLNADPDSPLLADRLGWYASDRGDAARALRLWRTLVRSDVLDQDVREVERAAAATGQRGGRNQPCWCGSGRKYKHCHLGSNDLEPLPERVGWLCRKAVAFLERRGGPAEVDVFDVASARAVDPDDPDSVADAYGDPIVMDLALTEGGWFARFLDERGALLPDDEALLAASWLLVDRTVYEILEVRPGDGLEVRDIRTGDHFTVRERTFSRQAQTGGLVCGRAVPDGHTHQFVGGLFPVAPGTETAVLDLLDDADPEEIAHYVAGLYRPPRLRTSEGEDLVQCEIVLDIGDPDAVRTVLDDIYDPDEADPNQWAEMYPPDDVDSDDRILRAILALEGRRLRVTTNSEERADRVLDVVFNAVPGLTVLSDTRRPFDPSALSPPPDGPGSQPPGDGPDLVLPEDVVEQVCDQLERRWCDEPVPALNGLTPRQAAADPTRRPGLVRLINSFEGQPLPAGAITMRPERLRRHLGLSQE